MFSIRAFSNMKAHLRATSGHRRWLASGAIRAD